VSIHKEISFETEIREHLGINGFTQSIGDAELKRDISGLSAKRLLAGCRPS
jgi:hypothetical protein